MRTPRYRGCHDPQRRVLLPHPRMLNHVLDATFVTRRHCVAACMITKSSFIFTRWTWVHACVLPVQVSAQPLMGRASTTDEERDDADEYADWGKTLLRLEVEAKVNERAAHIERRRSVVLRRMRPSVRKAMQKATSGDKSDPLQPVVDFWAGIAKVGPRVYSWNTT